MEVTLLDEVVGDGVADFVTRRCFQVSGCKHGDRVTAIERRLVEKHGVPGGCTVANDDGSVRANGVNVLGVDERFWSLGVSGAPPQGWDGEVRRTVAVNEALARRLEVAVMGTFRSTYGPTPTHRQALEIAESGFADVSSRLGRIVDTDLPGLREDLDRAGVPWTPGRGVPGPE